MSGQARISSSCGSSPKGPFVVSDSGATAVVTAYVMRDSSVQLSRAFAEGVISRGVDVVEAGLGSTDLLYFAAGSLDVPGAMFTASHNPAQYNGIKLCRAGAAPIGQESGLVTIRELAEVDSYDLCEFHAERLTVPRGWEVVRHEIDLDDAGPTGDDLLALADAVREAARPEPPRDPADDGRGTRRGHLRVLPDLT